MFSVILKLKPSSTCMIATQVYPATPAMCNHACVCLTPRLKPPLGVDFWCGHHSHYTSLCSRHTGQMNAAWHCCASTFWWGHIWGISGQVDCAKPGTTPAAYVVLTLLHLSER